MRVPKLETSSLAHFGTYSLKHQCIIYILYIWNHFSNIFASQNLELLGFLISEKAHLIITF